MKGDRSTFIAAGVGCAAVLCLGAVSLKVANRPSPRFNRPFGFYKETSRDHGVAQAKRELGRIYQALHRFAERTRRLPAGDPLNPRSEFRQELRLTDDDVRAPSEWGYNVAYWPRYLELRCDGVAKPAFPPKGTRDVWMTCETGGDRSSVVLLWSDGKIEERPGNQRLMVRPRSSGSFDTFYSSILIYPDEPGAPLVFRTLAQRDELRAHSPPPQFRVYPFGPPPLAMRGQMAMVSQMPLKGM